MGRIVPAGNLRLGADELLPSLWLVYGVLLVGSEELISKERISMLTGMASGGTLP